MSFWNDDIEAEYSRKASKKLTKDMQAYLQKLILVNVVGQVTGLTTEPTEKKRRKM